MNEQVPVEAGTRKGGGCGKLFLIGCLVFLVLTVIAVVLIVMNFESMMISMGRWGVVSIIEAQEIPEDQKKRMVAQVDRLTEDFKSGELDQQDIERVFEEILQSPLFAAGMVLVVEQTYLQKSGLDPAEKSEAGVSLRRFARGISDGRISRDLVEEVGAPALKSSDAGNFELKEELTDEELREIIAAAKAHADEAGVEAQVEEVDLADELERAIQRALDEPGSPSGELEEPK